MQRIFSSSFFLGHLGSDPNTQTQRTKCRVHDFLFEASWFQGQAFLRTRHGSNHTEALKSRGFCMDLRGKKHQKRENCQFARGISMHPRKCSDPIPRHPLSSIHQCQEVLSMVKKHSLVAKRCVTSMGFKPLGIICALKHQDPS